MTITAHTVEEFITALLVTAVVVGVMKVAAYLLSDWEE